MPRNGSNLSMQVSLLVGYWIERLASSVPKQITLDSILLDSSQKLLNKIGAISIS